MVGNLGYRGSNRVVCCSRVGEEAEAVRRIYYWIVATTDGKPSLFYGGKTEEEARMKGLELLAGQDFRIKELHTKNVSSASHELKYGRLEQTHSLTEATRRLTHERGLKRLRKRVNNRRAI